MSKGIGELQQSILNALEATKMQTLSYYGAGNTFLPGWVVYRKFNVLLPANVFDLRAVLFYLAQTNGKTQWQGSIYNCSTFQASFSRAVKSLIKRGCIEAPKLVPIKEYKKMYGYNKDCRFVHLLSDGMYMDCNRRQARFVVKAF